MKKIICVLLLSLLAPLFVCAQTALDEKVVKAKADFVAAESRLNKLIKENPSLEQEIKVVLLKHAALKEVADDAREDITDRVQAKNFVYQNLTGRIEELYEALYNLKKQNLSVYVDAYIICNHYYVVAVSNKVLSLNGMKSVFETHFPFLEIHDVDWFQENEKTDE